MIKIGVTVGEARTTDTGVERGLDVPVVVTISGRVHRGEVTLLPAEDGRPVYTAWGGSADMWMDGALLRVLRDLPSPCLREALDAVEAEASAVCGRPS